MLATLLLVTVPAVPQVGSAPAFDPAVSPVAVDDAPSCPTIAEVVDLGLACRRDDGLLNHYSASGELLGTVHGPDPVPSHAPNASLEGVEARPPACVERAEAPSFYGHVVYAVPVDWAPPDLDQVDRLRHLVERANGLLHATALDHGTTADYRMLCQDGELEVSIAVLPTLSDEASFSTIVQDLKAQGYNDPTAKYWVWYPDRGACTCGGMGHVNSEDTLSLTNANNGYSGSPMYGVTFGYESVRILMHENGHNLGAVQNSAPHTTGAHHCNDGRDIMCYDDGGPDADYSSSVCGWMRWDCGADDYYNPNPPEGSYLDSHWNLGHPYNRFIDGCFQERVRITEPGAPAHVSVPSQCAGHPFALIGSPGSVDHHLWPAYRGTLEVCWTDGAASLGCDLAYAFLWAHGRIPAEATGATLTLQTGAVTEVLLRAS